ncbi:Flp family type IVb pilin [Variovorax sp. V118]|uniref:Flp family type IVb pilin n=1 Tax=Variovorax sp. V118 TaxID=3065954 RepID=UPI0034E87477
MLSSITRFLRDEEGATAIEYGIIAGMMAVILTAVFATDGTLGSAITGVYSRISTALGGPAAD